MKIKLFFFSFLLTAIYSNGQVINFPDQAFKNALVANPLVNTNNDTEITIQEASAFTGELVVSNSAIYNLTGIEYFTSLLSLNCSSNCITNLNFSQNTSLTKLDCSFQYGCGGVNPPVFNLDFSNNVNLKYLNCGGNDISNINLSNNILLDTLELGQINLLNNIDLTSLINLKKLRIGSSIPPTANFQNIDFSSNVLLENLYLSYLYPLDTINLTNNVRLKYLDFSYAGADNYIGIENLDSLEFFNCLGCNASYFDLSQSTNLVNVSFVDNPELGMVSIKNGNNSNLQSVVLTQNPNLTCVEVDNVNYSNTNWYNGPFFGVDLNVEFNEYCLPLPRKICVVGLDSLTGNNRVVWEPDYPNNIDSIFIYRQASTANFQKIGSVSSSDFSTFLDPTALPSVQPYKYKLSALDSEGIETPFTDPHKTIHLTISQGIGNSWNLIWSLYEGLEFDNYKLYRGTNPTNFEEIAQISSDFNSYTDFTAPLGSTVYYQIGFENTIGCEPVKSGNYGEARSNIVFNGIASLSNTMDNFSIHLNESKELVIDCENCEHAVLNIAHSSGQNVLTNFPLYSTNTKIPMYEYCDGLFFISINGKTIKVVK
jgi:hypothetical protein